MASPACSVFTIGKLKLNKKKGTGKLTVTAPGAGKLTATGKGLKKTSSSPTLAGAVVLKLKASGKSKRKLKSSPRASGKKRLR